MGIHTCIHIHTHTHVYFNVGKQLNLCSPFSPRSCYSAMGVQKVRLSSFPVLRTVSCGINVPGGVLEPTLRNMVVDSGGLGRGGNWVEKFRFREFGL